MFESRRTYGMVFDALLVFFVFWFLTSHIGSTQDVAIFAGIMIWLRWTYWDH